MKRGPPKIVLEHLSQSDFSHSDSFSYHQDFTCSNNFSCDGKVSFPVHLKGNHPSELDLLCWYFSKRAAGKYEGSLGEFAHRCQILYFSLCCPSHFKSLIIQVFALMIDQSRGSLWLYERCEKVVEHPAGNKFKNCESGCDWTDSHTHLGFIPVCPFHSGPTLQRLAILPLSFTFSSHFGFQGNFCIGN